MAANPLLAVGYRHAWRGTRAQAERIARSYTRHAMPHYVYQAAELVGGNLET